MWQILEGAAEHVTRVAPAAQEICGVRWGSPCTTFRTNLPTPDLPKGCRGEGKEARGAGFGSAYRKRGDWIPFAVSKTKISGAFRERPLIQGKRSALLCQAVGCRVELA